MQSPFHQTVVYRHQKENLKKCSLRGLESRDDFMFFTYPKQCLPDVKGYILLALNAPQLTENDADKGLLIIDGTWRYAEKMLASIPDQNQLILRSLPSHFRTAYPRRQEDCSDPDRGLASIEAVYAAYRILGRPVDGLLDFYHWRDQFLHLNF